MDLGIDNIDAFFTKYDKLLEKPVHYVTDGECEISPSTSSSSSSSSDSASDSSDTSVSSDSVCSSNSDCPSDGR